jgi:hypothetical protein
VSEERAVSWPTRLAGLALLGVGLAAGALAAHGVYRFLAADEGTGLFRGIVLGIVAVALGALGWLLLRPPAAGDDAARRRWARRRLWAALVVGMCAFPAFFLTVTTSVVRGQAERHQTACLEHQRALAAALLRRKPVDGWPAQGGKAFVLALVAHGVLAPDDPGDLALLFCPACGMPDFEREMQHAYRGLTPESLDRTHLTSLTAYAGRRNDEAAYRLDAAGAVAGEEPILACLCHPRRALVAFADGSARLLDRKQLGLGPDDPLIVGESSRSPILKKLSFD